MPCSIPPGTGTPSSPAGVPVRTLETGQAVPGRVCAAKQEKYYGFKAGMLMNSAGEIFRWWPANTDEREMLDAMVSAMSGLLFADKGLISADFSWPGAV